MKIDVSPDMPMYNLLKSYPYELSGALSEYIDNSLQAYLDAPEDVKSSIGQLEVNIEISLKDKHSQFIKVKDNGVGISSENLQRAMKPGFQPAEQSLHEFGIGMKAASVWLGREWDLKSSPINEHKTYVLDFDLDKLIRLNQREVEVKESERKKNDGSGVEITVTKLRDISEEEVMTACTDLHDVYQIFIYREKILKLTFTLDDTSEDLMNQKVRKAPEPLNYPNAYFTKPTWSDKGLAFKYGETKLWKEDISFDFNGLPVSGFISVREEASPKSNPGLALFRYKRLIQGSESKEYRPKALLGTQNKAAPSKVYMELHLDGQPISHTKGKFNFDEQRFLKLLKDHPVVKDYIEQAEAHRPTYEADEQVISCESKEEIKKHIADYKKQHDSKRKKASTKNTGPKANSGKKEDTKPTTPNPVSVLDHNDNWDLLLPSIFNKTDSTKLNSLIVEANSLLIKSNPYATCFLLRSIIERCLFSYFKHCGKLSNIIEWEYQKQLRLKEKKKEDTSSAVKIKKPGIDHMIKWILADGNSSVFEEDEKDCISSVQKLSKNVSVMNGVVHQEDFINAYQVSSIRDDAYPLLKHMLDRISLSKQNEATVEPQVS